jgi:hypothetical protein
MWMVIFITHSRQLSTRAMSPFVWIFVMKHHVTCQQIAREGMA